MSQNLDELKDRLYRAFDRAADTATGYSVTDSARADNARAAAELAKAIVIVETRIDERDERKNALRLPGKG